MTIKLSNHTVIYKETQPIHELQRASQLTYLKAKYEKLCKSKLKIEKSPDESFSRWLIERRLHETKFHDPIIAMCEKEYDVRKHSMYQDITRDIPVPISAFQAGGNSSRFLYHFATGSLKFVEDCDSESTSATRIREYCNRELNWLERQSQFQVPEEAYKRLCTLRSEVYPHLESLIGPKIESICKEMNNEGNLCSENMLKTTNGYKWEKIGKNDPYTS